MKVSHRGGELAANVRRTRFDDGVDEIEARYFVIVARFANKLFDFVHNELKVLWKKKKKKKMAVMKKATQTMDKSHFCICQRNSDNSFDARCRYWRLLLQNAIQFLFPKRSKHATHNKKATIFLSLYFFSLFFFFFSQLPIQFRQTA